MHSNEIEEPCDQAGSNEELREKTLTDRYSQWLLLWAKGKTVGQMATILGKPIGSIGPKITELRRNLGWFPARAEIKRPGKKRLPPEERDRREKILAEKHAELRRLWHEGETVAGIAQCVGKPHGTVSATIIRFRRRYGWFPRRKVVDA